MHQFFSTLFAMLFSLCHHGANLQPVQTAAVYENLQPTPSLSFPDHRDLLRVAASQSGYAGSACDSCRGMSVSFSAR